MKKVICATPESRTSTPKVDQALPPVAGIGSNDPDALRRTQQAKKPPPAGVPQQTQSGALPKGSGFSEATNRRRRPPRHDDTSHLSDKRWEAQSSDPRNRRE